MIVRISTEGQYELQDKDAEALDELDRQAIEACEANDEQQFDDVFARLVEFVRANGRPVPDDQLGPSDIILPPPDSTMVEARAEFSAEGLIPE
jgi:hypothetical protein